MAGVNEPANVLRPAQKSASQRHVHSVLSEISSQFRVFPHTMCEEEGEEEAEEW